MGYKIEVNHSILKSSSNEIDEYINLINQYMKKADEEVYSLVSTNWNHQDANTFKSKWIDLSNQHSVTSHMKSSLRNYANSLRYAESQYKKAQNAAVTVSKLLKIW